MKLKFKFLFIAFALFLMTFNSICFATDTNNDIMLISEPNENFKTETVNTINSDLYIANESEYEINNIVNGNVFASVDNLNLDPSNNGGIIQGNLFVAADSVNIKSVVTYSDNEKDDLGNPIITIDKSSTISGNVFLVVDKFVLEPGCKIDGDLYICANEVYLEQNSKVNGNVFICASKFDLNAEISGNLYASVDSFNMKYFGFISRDLYLTAEEVNLNGWIYRNSFITAKKINTEHKFINQGNFTVKAADNLVFSGEILGDATINTKNIYFKNNDDNKDLTCKIDGKLSYSSKEELEIPEGIVLKEITYSNYTSTSTKNILSSIWDYILNLITSLVCLYVIYLLTSKFAPKFLDKFSNISVLSLLKYLGIGLGGLILVPIISIFLLISNIGSILGLIILLIYIVILIIAKPIFIISIATFVKNKISDKINLYLYILAITVILSLTSLIPYLGFIISMLVTLIGFGMIVRNLMPSKNK